MLACLLISVRLWICGVGGLAISGSGSCWVSAVMLRVGVSIVPCRHSRERQLRERIW